MQEQSHSKSKVSIQTTIVLAFFFMLSGTGLELILLEHFEDWQQLIPIVCIACSCLLGAWLLVKRSSFLEKGFWALLLLNAISGVYGTYLHLSANLEFAQEMKPGASSLDLFFESLSGALPSLAPGSMILLAILGYSYLLLIKQKQ